MRRIFPPYAYSDAPRDGCWWDETGPVIAHKALDGDTDCDVAVVGGGFTGLSAALHVARRGAKVVLLDAMSAGWGASGRNGGFCCLGGSMRSDAGLDRRYGVFARREWRAAEKAAVERVGTLISELSLDVDRHSVGETCLAHRSKDVARFAAEAQAVCENYGVDADILAQSDLAFAGLSGPFHGAITVPIGFGLNPRKLVNGLVDACTTLGVTIHDNSPVVHIRPRNLRTIRGSVRARKVIVATNGYSSEDIPEWLAARYMPAQSTVLVTRPLTDGELQAQGWSSDQMAYDTRSLLHYFRLMPDRRFLFGMRGGLQSGPDAERAARDTILRDFRKMFPAWAAVDVTHSWSGMVCLSRSRVPYVGHVPEMPDVLAGFAFHGNGIAMGIHSGAILAALASDERPTHYPHIMSIPASRFPFGSLRRIVMPAAYAALKALDSVF